MNHNFHGKMPGKTKKKVPPQFYFDQDLLGIARNLIGKKLVTNLQGITTAGIITETEAYHGIEDQASHAYGGLRTKRNEAMYMSGGVAYVYLCYGIHNLFNVVTNSKGIPHAVLIRAICPTQGIREILSRRKAGSLKPSLTSGPGKVSEALGISTNQNGISLLGNQIWIEQTDLIVPDSKVLVGPRIGVDYAGSDAHLPYRFLVSPGDWNSLFG
jgi:DNA-3-methyladenine glycosylase